MGVSARLWVYGPDGRPNVLPLGSRPLLVGRADHCDVCLTDEAVSRDHLEISLHGSALVATDLDSLNGTMLNGGRLDRPARLKDGDILFVGGHRLHVQLLPQPERGGTTKRASPIPRFSEEELEIARALVAPYRRTGQLAPATRRVIAEGLNMSESKVKRRMGSLARKIGIPPHASRDRPRLIAERVIELDLDHPR